MTDIPAGWSAETKRTSPFRSWRSNYVATRISLIAALCLAFSFLVECLSAQDVVPLLAVSIYEEPSVSTSGPIFAVGGRKALSDRLNVVALGYFRDDDRSRGRLRASGVGAELRYTIRSSTRNSTAYLLGAIALERLVVDGRRSPGVPLGGFYARGAVGVGLALDYAGRHFTADLRRSESNGGSYWSTQFSVSQSRRLPSGGPRPPSVCASLSANQWRFDGESVARDVERFGYDFLVRECGPERRLAWSASAGFFFFISPSLGTGVLTASVGPTLEVVDLGPIEFVVSTQAGVGVPVEGNLDYPPILGRAQAGLYLSLRGLHVFGGLESSVWHSPFGFTAGWSPQVGLGIVL